MEEVKGEVGEVIGIEDGRLVVRLQRMEACAKCRACTAGIEDKEMIIKAINDCNGKIGDKVTIALDSSDFYKATLIMYGIPFIMFLAGVFGGYYGSLHFDLPYAEVIGIVAGFLLILVTYGIIHTQEYRFKKTNYVPKAISIVE